MDLLAVRAHLLATRKRKDYTQDEVAEDAGVSQPTVSRLEQLETDMAEVEFETIRKIVEDGLAVKLSTFFDEIEQSRKPSGDLPTARPPVPTELESITVADFLRAVQDFALARAEPRRSVSGARRKKGEKTG